MYKVSVRNGFSDRNNIKKENEQIQINDFDERTRVQLANMISQIYNSVYDGDLYYGKEHIQSFIKYVLRDIYSVYVDERKTYSDGELFAEINNTFFFGDYDDILTFIEEIVNYWSLYLKRKSKAFRVEGYIKRDQRYTIYNYVNDCFKKEYVGYRFVNNIIVPISDEIENNEIQQASSNKYEVVREHLTKSLKLISDRKKPDYENSIKESISAVEALCEVMTGIKGKEATLGKLLKKLEEKGVVIHSGLKAAFNTLYGYTSDANGIRHAGDIGGPSSTFEEAKFMLVSCSAFINYLMAVSAD